MEKTVNISALRIAAQFDLNDIQRTLKAKSALHSTELFYTVGPDQYANYFKYGVAVFINHPENDIFAAIDKIKGAMIRPEPPLRQDHTLKIVAGGNPEVAGMKFESEQIVVAKLDEGSARTIMSSLAQAIVLDHYNKISSTLLKEVRSFTINLEVRGKLKVRRKEMMKFIGRTLNTQNDIADNSHIFAVQEQGMGDANQETLHQDLVKHLDIRRRVSEIEFALRIVEDNLKVFLQISNQRESNLLEWIIIILILVEIVNLFVTQWIK